MDARQFRPPSWRRTIEALVIGLFLVTIYAPLADELVRSDEARGPAPEARSPAPRPALAFDATTLKAFPEAYEAWFKDSFGLRDVLLRCHSIVKVFFFHVSPTPSVILGRDDSMIYAEALQIDAFRGLAPLSRAQLEAWRRVLEGNRDRLRERGVEYLFVIAPNKETIYSERLPARFNRVGPSRFDQLLVYLEKRSDARILDLRPVLVEAKREDRPDDEVYLHDGTHWNARGAFVAYRRMLEALAKAFPALEPMDASEFSKVRVGSSGDSWAPRMYIGDLRRQSGYAWRVLPEPRARVVVDVGPPGVRRKRVTELPDADLPRGLLVHDSFGPYVEKFLAEHFSRLTCVGGQSVDAAELDAEKPDVVIQLFVERVLLRSSPDNMTLPASDGDR